MQNLGGYSGDLTIDEQNMALRNSGSTFQLQQPEVGASAPGGQQFDTGLGLGGQPQQSAPTNSTPPPVPGGEALAPPSPTEQAPSAPKRDTGNMASKVLGLVGGLVGGIPGMVIGMAGKK